MFRSDTKFLGEIHQLERELAVRASFGLERLLALAMRGIHNVIHPGSDVAAYGERFSKMPSKKIYETVQQDFVLQSLLPNGNVSYLVSVSGGGEEAHLHRQQLIYENRCLAAKIDGMYIGPIAPTPSAMEPQSLGFPPISFPSFIQDLNSELTVKSADKLVADIGVSIRSLLSRRFHDTVAQSRA